MFPVLFCLYTLEHKNAHLILETMASWDTLEILGQVVSVALHRFRIRYANLSVFKPFQSVECRRVRVAHPVVPGLMWRTVMFGLEHRRTSLSYKPSNEIGGLVKQALI